MIQIMQNSGESNHSLLAGNLKIKLTCESTAFIFVQAYMFCEKI